MWRGGRVSGAFRKVGKSVGGLHYFLSSSTDIKSMFVRPPLTAGGTEEPPHQEKEQTAGRVSV